MKDELPLVVMARRGLSLTASLKTIWTRVLWPGLFLLGLSPVVMSADLMQVYRQAQARDSVYEAARASFAAAEQKLPQARAGLLPTLGLTAASAKQRGEASFAEAPFVERDARTWNWTLQLTQPLWRWTNWIAYDQARAQLRQAEQQLRQAEQELMLRVAQAYFDVLNAQQALRVAETQTAAVEQQWGLARRNYEVGSATITDVHEARSRFDLARAQQVAARNEVETRRAELERVVGELPNHLAQLPGEPTLPKPEPMDVQAWVDNARTNNVQVLQQQAALEVAEKEIARQRAAHQPTLDLTLSRGNTFASGSVTSPADIKTRTQSSQVGVQLNLPLFSGGGVNARVKEALALRQRSQAELESTRRLAATQTRQAFVAVVNGLEQIEALQSAVQTSRSAVEANKVGYRIGTRINIDVLNAEQQLYTAQRDLFKARIDTLLQGLRLKAATGILQEADLQTINFLLQEEAKP